MVEYNTEILDATFAALADPTRRAILEKLAGGEQSVSELATPFDMSLAAVSKHIQLLTRANLISQHKKGRVRQCRLEPEAFEAAVNWIEHYRDFWTEKFTALEAFLENEATNPKTKPKQGKRKK
ncbi:metalloregulator ArsR/SmtB family transcription factor [Sneathiella marina]|uniref:Metalloregulator ArsR/SmtB family transcription factor n=1 Tax=Sneathiella marina TaxID=2950108 RepID=A0ABY4W7M9_9PROT|nr:metalloregulator ArsR/SmtB family transcription factor [Sneathiella marina]USG62904.1 metalloregulator ArsR/SmtB family transcription factor [Sneathiella marina]